MSIAASQPSRRLLRLIAVAGLLLASMLCISHGGSALIRTLEVQAATTQARETCGMARDDFLQLPQAAQQELRVSCAPVLTLRGR